MFGDEQLWFDLLTGEYLLIFSTRIDETFLNE